MLSWHPTHPGNDKSKKDQYGWGFRVANTDDIRRQANGMTTHTWSPNIYREGTRRESHWISSDWIALDFDAGELSLAAAVKAFCDVRHVISTTMNHQKAKEDGTPAGDRFRVALCIKRIDNLAIYRNNLRIMVDRYGADVKCKDGARFFFPSREIISVNDEDDMWELDMTPPPEPQFAQMQAARAEAMTIPHRIRFLLKHCVWAQNTKNDTCFQIGCALGSLGYPPKDICHLIYASPTYRNTKITDALAREIYQAVTNGIKRSISDLAALPQQ